MAGKFEEQQKKQFLEAFKLFDRDNSGQISKQELAIMIKQLGGNQTQSQIQDLINQIDVDGNGSIDFPQFLALMAKKMTSINSQNEVKEAFDIFDCNGDKYITFSELKEVLARLGQKMSDEEILNMIKQADEDGDGKVSYQQFDKLMKR